MTKISKKYIKSKGIKPGDPVEIEFENGNKKLGYFEGIYGISEDLFSFQTDRSSHYSERYGTDKIKDVIKLARE